MAIYNGFFLKSSVLVLTRSNPDFSRDVTSGGKYVRIVRLSRPGAVVWGPAFAMRRCDGMVGVAQWVRWGRLCEGDALAATASVRSIDALWTRAGRRDAPPAR